MHHLVSALAASEDGRGTFADPDGVAYAVAGAAEDLGALAEQLVVRQEARADVDAVDSVDAHFRSRDGFEVLALRDDGAHDAAAVLVGNGFHEGIGGQDRDAEPADAVRLDGESALVGHGFDDGLDLGSGLHRLVGGEIADVAGTHREDVLSEEGELRVHHPLHDGGGIDAGQVVILEGRHEGQGAGGDDELVGIDIEDLLGCYILDCQTLPLQDIPDHTVQQDAFPGVSGEGFGDVESAHAAELLLLLEEEELVRLHPELPADGAVVINHEVVHPGFPEFLPHGESGRTCADDGDRGLVDFLGRIGGRRGFHVVETVFPGAVYLLYAVHLGDADPADVAVHDHFAGAAFADAALHRAVAVFQTMVMDGKSGLMQRGGDGLAFLAVNGLPFELKCVQVFLRDVQNRMLRDLVHIGLVRLCGSGDKDRKTPRNLYRTKSEKCRIIIRTPPAAPPASGHG